MATTMNGNRLKKVKVTGKNMSAELEKSCTSASLSASQDAETQMSFTFADSKDAKLFNSGLLVKGSTITYGAWRLTVDSLDFGPGNLGPQLTVRAPSKFITDLRGETGAKNWGTVDVAAWVKDTARRTGMKTVIQPNLGRKAAVRKKPDGDQKDSTWDVLNGLAAETGAWLFEYGSTLVFARPSWLAGRSWGNRSIELDWDDWANYSDALAGMPSYSRDPSQEAAEKLTLRLVSVDADSVRPGDDVRLTGRNAGDMKGQWIVVGVDFPLHKATPVTVTCQRPIDPEKEES